MTRIRQNIPITETWLRHDWDNFTTAQAVTDGIGLGQVGDGGSNDFGIATQDHIDVRTFDEGSWTTAGCTFTGGYHSFTHGPATSEWPAGQVAVPTDTGTIRSNYTTPIDLTPLGTDTELTVALFNLPLTHIDLANSFLDLSSDGFNTAICSLPWSASTTAPTAGNCTLTWPYSALTGIDLTKVTGVQFRITVTSSCTVYLLALRLIGSQWVVTNLDFDDLNGQLRQGIPLDADPAVFPLPDNQTLPPLWRSASPSSVDDPQPIDATMEVLFNTGSQTNVDSLTLYMRGRHTAFATQQDLQGQTQATLSGHTPPTLGLDIPARDSWVSFTLTWGTTYAIQVTDDTGQSGYDWSGFTLDNNTDYLMICSLEDTNARLEIWNVDQTTLAIGSLVFDTTLIPDLSMFSRHAGRVGFGANLGDGDSYISFIRPRSLTFAEYRSSPLRSLTPVRGAQLFVTNSPDTELLQTDNTVDSSGWNPITSNPEPTITIDQLRFVEEHPDHQSTKVTFATPASTPQGIATNLLTANGDATSGITDFGNLHISFDIWVPSAALNSPVRAGNTFPSPTLYPGPSVFTSVNTEVLSLTLISEHGNVIPIELPGLAGDEWESIELMMPIPEDPRFPVSGLYQLALYYSGSIPTYLWLDDVDIHQHSIRWEGRSVSDDPWHSNDAPWTTFHDTINGVTDGIRFNEWGTELQMHALALRQDAVILGHPNLVPQYAPLGRLVWPENAFDSAGSPTASISKSHTGRAYTFNGTGSSGANIIGNWQWDFGDGHSASGPFVSHTYASWLASGTYSVNLVVTDRGGLIAQTTTTVTL